MTSLLGAKKRAEEFAAAVDRSRPTDARHPETPELAELVGLVGSLRSLDAPSPRPGFSATLREQLLAEAEGTLATNAVLTLPARRRGARERRLAAAASAFVLVGGTAGMAAAAQNALPGDALYPIKRGLERAETDLSSGDGAKGRQLLDQATHRLGEAEALLDSSRVTQVPATLDAFTSQAQRGAELLLSAYAADGETGDITTLRDFASDGLTALQELARIAPASAQERLTTAALTLQRIDQAASEACSSCSDLPALQMPPLFLTAADATRALDAGKSAVLDNAHPMLPEHRSDAALPPESVTDPIAPDAPTNPQDPQAPPSTPGTPTSPSLGDLKVDGPKGVDEAVKKTEEIVDGVRKGLKDITKPLLPDVLDPALDSLLQSPSAGSDTETDTEK